MFASNFLSQVSDLRKDFDKSKEIESYKENIKDGKAEDNVSRNTIEPSLLVNSFELEFERDIKGDKISLGKGAFGNVLIADYHGTKCAYKEILPSALTQETLERFFLELKLVGQLRHPNIAQCLGVVWESEEHGIMFEMCKNGGLDDFQKKHKEHGLVSWSNTAAVQEARDNVSNKSTQGSPTLSMLVMKGIGLKMVWALQICKGCAFLHGRSPPIVHRDLKCANVLVSDDVAAKITDFGESRNLDNKDERTMTTVGTPFFMAPEVFSNEDKDRIYSKSVDIYSFAILLLEIFYDGEVKKGFRKGWGPVLVMKKVGEGWRPDLKLVEKEDKELADIIRRCWQEDPELRPPFKELVKFFERKVKENIDELAGEIDEKDELDEETPTTINLGSEKKEDIKGVAEDPIMAIFAAAGEKHKGFEKRSPTIASLEEDPVMAIFGEANKKKEAQKVDPVMAIFGEANKKKEAQKVDPVMAIFEQAKEEKKKKPMEVELKREAVKEAKPQEAEGVTERDGEGNLTTKNPQKKNVVHPKGSASTLKFVALAILLCLFLAGLSEVEGREHMQDEYGIMRARNDREFHKTSTPLPWISNINNRGFANEELLTLLEKGGEGRVRRAEEVNVFDMNGLFNTVSNSVYSGYNTGNSIMANGDTTILAVGSYKGSQGTCAHSSTMLGTEDLSGEIKCVEDNASCVLDGENERRGMWVRGTGSGTLILRALTFDKGHAGAGGGVNIQSGAKVDLELLVFSNNRATHFFGGGSVYVDGGTGTTVNVYGTSFTGNTASHNGDDIYNNGGFITIHNTCPSPYSSNTPIQGKTRMRIV
jgi:serine/threonine protein kinase